MRSLLVSAIVCCVLNVRVSVASATDQETNDVATMAAEALKRRGAVIEINDQGDVIGVSGRKIREKDLAHVARLNWAQTRSVKESENRMGQIVKPSLGIRGANIGDTGFSQLLEMTHLRSLQLISFNRLELSNAELGALVENLPLLEELIVHSARIGDDGLKHLAKLPNLSFLWLSNNPISDAGLEHLRGLRFQNLTRLILNGNPGITDRGARIIAEIAPNLETLTVSGTQLTDAAFVDLKKLKHLEQLAISETQITDAGLVHIKDFPNLRSLKLRKNALGDAGMVHLKDQTRLTVLELENTNIGDAGLQHLSGLTNLWALNLMHTRITDKNLAILENFANLAHLDLDGTAVSNQGISHLKGMNSLEAVGLAETQVDDAGLIYFRDMNKLWRLRLGPKVNGSGLEHLAELPSLTALGLGEINSAGVEKLIKLKRLKNLWVGGTNLSDEEIVRLKNELADCRISISK